MDIATPPDALPDETLLDSITRARNALAHRQHADGHWVFELEADATIAAEYIVLQHFLGESNPALEAKIAIYLRRLQGPHGGWALFHGGAFNISASARRKVGAPSCTPAEKAASPGATLPLRSGRSTRSPRL